MQQIATKIQTIVLASILAVTAFVQARAATVDTAVGEVTLVIGQAHILAADGRQQAVRLGDIVRVGNTIQTEAGGHVHLRFVDGGRVSVRPASRLLVQSYAYSAEQPQLSAIKFKLEEGVVRSITGTWGEADRQRFRLNTPLAAIGIKGTDFIVQSTAERTAATVFTGAITVAPLQGACASALGSCQGGMEKMLSEDMKGQMLELARVQAAPSLVPAVSLMAASTPQATMAPVLVAHKTQSGEVGTLADTVDKPLLNESRVAGVVHELGSEARPSAALQWARYPWARQIDGDNFSREFETAMLQGYERLGGNGAYALLRPVHDAAGAAALNVPSVGVASFKLSSSAATVIRDGGRLFEPAQIADGSLNIDFGNSRFDTRLQVTGPWPGADTVQAAGRITDTGVMQVTSGNVNLQGGVGHLGHEAGYLFQKTVPYGILQGLTLWGR